MSNDSFPITRSVASGEHNLVHSIRLIPNFFSRVEVISKQKISLSCQDHEFIPKAADRLSDFAGLRRWRRGTGESLSHGRAVGAKTT